MRLLFSLLLIIPFRIFASSIDFKLDKVIEIYGLQGFSCNTVQPSDPLLSPLGEALFESKLLSGGQDTSCSTCHLKELSRVDGLPISVGVGGHGEGVNRLKHGKGILVPRNSFTLAGRGHSNYKTYFWDGKVEVESERIVSIIGDGKGKGFHSPLALASVLPILARDEFLGLLENTQENGMISINDSYYEDRYFKASSFLRKQISTSEGDEWDELRKIFIDSKIEPENLKLSDIGNAISAFLIDKENCVENKWSQYVRGNKESLTEQQKQGAFLFYGKGRCVSCHQGDLFSDFSFHSIGTPQGEFGVSIYGQDLGRSEISLNYEDRFKFKTPSLLNVSKTKPYGHNGAFQTLDEIVLFHLNPMPFFKNKEWTEKELYSYGRILSSRSKMLSYIDVFTKEEFEQLISFLEAI